LSWQFGGLIISENTLSFPELQAAEQVFYQASNKLTQEPARRFILGITGPPACGKSTLAGHLVTALNNIEKDFAQALPMDGFHLHNAELDAKGWRAKKGAPHTFDVHGFVSTLESVRKAPRKNISWPLYDRHVLHAPIPDGMTIQRDTKLAIVEGNYLLLSEGPWAGVSDLLDVSWYLEVDEDVAIKRLLARHLIGGEGEKVNRKRIFENDLVNSVVIEGTKWLADKVFPAGFFSRAYCDSPKSQSPPSGGHPTTS
jgi:pantothenate kinase